MGFLVGCERLKWENLNTILLYVMDKISLTF